MKQLVAVCVILISAAISSIAPAAVKDLEDKIADVKRKTTAEEQVNMELKTQLAAKETAVSAAKVKLNQIEEQIAAFRKEHHIESK